MIHISKSDVTDKVSKPSRCIKRHHKFDVKLARIHKRMIEVRRILLALSYWLMNNTNASKYEKSIMIDIMHKYDREYEKLKHEKEFNDYYV